MIKYTPLLSDTILALTQKDKRQLVVITDEHVGALYANALLKHLGEHAKCMTIPAGEASKTRETKAWIEDKLFELGCGRDTRLIALGGGVVTDLVGFVAATFCRGVPVIYIPTSLLAMVDAAIGGKTGVNIAAGKNLIGTFTLPEAVLVDVSLLQTLPDTEYINALSEVLKHALIADKAYFEFICEHIRAIQAKDEAILLSLIQKSIEIKSTIVSEDSKEQSKREVLNFGHTIAHALELYSHYEIHHGHAVAIGLKLESYLSNQLGLLSGAELKTINTLILNLNLPLSFDFEYTPDAIFKALQYDKKTRQSKPRFVLLKSIGKAYQINNSWAHEVDAALVKQALDTLLGSVDNCPTSPICPTSCGLTAGPMDAAVKPRHVGGGGKCQHTLETS